MGLYLNPPGKALVLCVDEKSQVQALERTQPRPRQVANRGDAPWSAGSMSLCDDHGYLKFERSQPKFAAEVPGKCGTPSLPAAER